MDFALILLTLLNIIIIFLLLKRKTDHSAARFDAIGNALERLEKNIKDEFRYLQENTSKGARENREELSKSLGDFRTENSHILKNITGQNLQSLEAIHKTLDESFKEFQKIFAENIRSFNEVQREKFGELDKKQSELLQSTEKRLDEMRATVDEKLQKTLHERIGQSFELVSKQLEHVQKGLGEMQNLAQDVGGLKKVLGNVKMRGSIGEVQLEMLLEQILAPEQYEANVKTKKGSDNWWSLPSNYRVGKITRKACIFRLTPNFLKMPTNNSSKLMNRGSRNKSMPLPGISKPLSKYGQRHSRQIPGPALYDRFRHHVPAL